MTVKRPPIKDEVLRIIRDRGLATAKYIGGILEVPRQRINYALKTLAEEGQVKLATAMVLGQSSKHNVWLFGRDAELPGNYVALLQRQLHELKPAPRREIEFTPERTSIFVAGVNPWTGAVQNFSRNVAQH